MIETPLPLSNLAELKNLASVDSKCEIVVRSMERDLYVVVLRLVQQGVEIGLGTVETVPELQTFRELEDCVRVAIGLSRVSIRIQNRPLFASKNHPHFALT